MNDHELELDLALVDFGARRVQPTAPPVLRQRIRTMPLPMEAGRSWPSWLPKWRFDMFSALKFIAAGVIVALFGGFLLTGVLTTPQEGEVLPGATSGSPEPEVTSEPTEAADQSVRTDILPGVALTVEEVEPGVLRVVGDGVRESFGNSIAAGQDGSIWSYRYRHSIYRLGSSIKEPHKLPTDSHVEGFAVARDGTVWLHQGERLYSNDGEGWTVRLRKVAWFTIAPDGTVWAAQSRRGPDGLDLARLGADGWEPLGERLLYPGWPLATGGEEAWAEVGDASGRSIWRYHEDDGAWHEITTLPRPAYSLLLDDFVYGGSEGSVMGSDGTIWFAYPEPLMLDGELVLDEDGQPTLGDSILMRFDGSGWQRWGTADGVPSLLVSTLTPAPDRGLWVRSNTRWDPGGPYVDGIFRFDGSTWRHYLPDHVIDSMDFAPDGSVWLLSGADDLYVITPDVVAASE